MTNTWNRLCIQIYIYSYVLIYSFISFRQIKSNRMVCARVQYFKEVKKKMLEFVGRTRRSSQINLYHVYGYGKKSYKITFPILMLLHHAPFTLIPIQPSRFLSVSCFCCHSMLRLCCCCFSFSLFFFAVVLRIQSICAFVVAFICRWSCTKSHS